MADDEKSKDEQKTIAIFASPKCVEEPRLYKAYFNVAWFVRAYKDVLEGYKILTTRETMIAVNEALGKLEPEHNKYNYWNVPEEFALEGASVGREGFDGQVRLAGEVASGKVERVLMFMDPLDTKEYLPETYAFIRNCALADVGLHINLGATYWAESARQDRTNVLNGFGPWRTNQEQKTNEEGEMGPRFHDLLDPKSQTVYFIAHDGEKEKLSNFAYHYRTVLANRARTAWTLSGTSGTSSHITETLAERNTPYWETPRFKAAGAGTTGHGPTGGDVIIAYDICERWPVTEQRQERRIKETCIEEDPRWPSAPGAKHTIVETKVNGERDVRDEGLSHTVLFFINYSRPQPHEADIHLLLRTCLNPHRGVHLILNERTAVEWGETIREGCFSKWREASNLEPGNQ